MTRTDPSSHIDSSILGEAADWLIKFQSNEVDEADRLAFEHWRNQSAAHTAAWQRIESVLSTFKQIPPEIGHGTLQRLDKPDRRRMVRMLGLLIMTAPTAWLAWHHLPWQEWTADLRTATGEQKTIELADGTHLVLNTASAVDIIFNHTERRLRLHAGEILVTTGRDPSSVYRPFIVQTPHGTVHALGTRFSIRCFDQYTRVIVFQDAVEIHPVNAQTLMLHAGEQIDYRIDGTQSFQRADVTSALWAQGMFAARNIRLADLVRELGRYRQGVIRCHPDVADMPVSGAFPLKDIDISLQLLEKTMPLRIRHFSRYWVTIERS